MMLFVECCVPDLWWVCLLACELYVCLQSKTAEGKTAAATATPTSTATERSATPTDKKEKSRSERKRVRVMSVFTVQKRCMSYMGQSCSIIHYVLLIFKTCSGLPSSFLRTQAPMFIHGPLTTLISLFLLYISYNNIMSILDIRLEWLHCRH